MGLIVETHGMGDKERQSPSNHREKLKSDFTPLLTGPRDPNHQKRGWSPDHAPRSRVLPMLRPARPRLWIGLAGLWAATVGLLLLGLGNLPLRDWDEALVARVSLELSRQPWSEPALPTYLGQPYLNKPPGLHGLIAILIRLWRQLSAAAPLALPPEWIVRLIPALGASLIVPLLGLVQARLRPGQTRVALATALIPLTLMPLMRHGRMAMLDGTQLSAMALIWWGMLSTGLGRSQTLAGGVVAGLGGSGLLLLKAPVALPVLAVAVGLRWLDRALDRRGWGLLLAGLLLGLLPGILWHGWHLLERGPLALVMWGAQGVARITTSLDDHSGGPLVPLLQLITGGWPWLPLWPFGLALAWRERRGSAGRWVLGLSLMAALLVFPLRTQLPWYSLLLWPPFALACGPVLASIGQKGAAHGVPTRGIGRIWLGLGGLLLILAALSLAPFAQALAPYRLLVVPAGIGLLTAGWLLVFPGGAGGGLAVALLALGWYGSLLLLFSGQLWNWELNEQPPIAPAVALANPAAAVPPGPAPPLSTDGESSRPSLLWYINAEFPPLAAGSDPERIPPVFGLISQAGSLQPPDGYRCEVIAAGAQQWKRWRCERQ